MRTAASVSLGMRKDARAVEPLVAALLNDRAPEVRENSAMALRQIGGAAVVPLVAVLGHKDRDARDRVVATLGEIGDERALDGVLILLRDRELMVRLGAVVALTRIGDPRAVDGLVAALHDGDDNMRMSAAQALGAFGDDRAGEGWRVPWRDRKPAVRSKAAEALGAIGDPRTVRPLVAALADREAGVREGAMDALGRIGEPSVAPMLASVREKDPPSRRGGPGAWAIADMRALDGLLAALTDTEPIVRAAAAESLGALGDERAVGPWCTRWRTRSPKSAPRPERRWRRSALLPWSPCSPRSGPPTMACRWSRR